MKPTKTLSIPTVVNCVLLLAIPCGCVEKRDESARVAEVAMQAAETQARQSEQVAKASDTMAQATKEMVAADAQARKEMIVMHQGLQQERATLHDGFDQLETERRQIATERRTESILVPAFQSIGGTLAIAAVGLFCLLLLLGLWRSDATDAELSEVLIHELASEQPTMLSRPGDRPAIEQRAAEGQLSSTALPAAEE